MSVVQKYRIDPNIIHTTLDENESVLLHLNTKRYYSLNETGSKIWQHLQAGIPPETISVALESEYEITDAKNYVAEFLEILRREGLLTHG